MEEGMAVLPEAPVTTVGGFNGVVTPHHPRTDENAAIAVFKYRERERLQLRSYPIVDIVFWGHPECPQEKQDEFLMMNFIPIEIGDLSYRKVKRSNDEPATSATEALVITLGYDPANISYGEIKLMEILAQRNGYDLEGQRIKGGYMNKFPMSIPLNLRNIYGLEGYNELDIMTRYQDIVLAYIEYENRPEDTVKTQIQEELQDLARMTEKCQNAAFTPGRYLRDLCYRGEPADQIREKVQFWIKASNACQREYLKTRDEWPKMEKLKFLMEGMRGAAVETTNQFVSKVVFNHEDMEAWVGFGIVIIRNPDSGHSAILTNNYNRRKDVSSLHTELERLEPGLWHRQDSNIFNGTDMYRDVPRSDQSLSQLAGLVSRFPPR